MDLHSSSKSSSDLSLALHTADTSLELLDAEISWAEQLHKDIQQRLSALKSKRNSFATTARIPVEVLAEIMVATCNQQICENNQNEEDYPVSLPVPLILGHVCASWRSLAWSISKLWATIPLALCKRRYETQVVLLDEWLARAGTIQSLHLILTLKYDHTEHQYWRDYPPKEVLGKLYACSTQWHTFYSTLPNLCMDLFTTVYGRLPRLHTLILNRSGRLAYDVFYPPAPTIPPATSHGQHNNAQTTAVITGVDYHGATSSNSGTGTAPPPPLDLIRHWGMLSDAPSLQSVSLPEGLSPFEMQLPWNQVTHLELRTIPLYDCLRVLEHTPLIESCDFYGVYSTMMPTPGTHAFFPPPPLPPNPYISETSTYTGSGLYLTHLTRLKLFADPANLAHFLESITAPSLTSLSFKSTTIALTPVTAQLVRLIERSGCQIRQLGVCVPSIGKAAEQLVTMLSGKEMKGLEEICLESWQVDVEGLGDWFWEKMMPERRRKKAGKGQIYDDSGSEDDGFGIERLSMSTQLFELDPGFLVLNKNREGGVDKEQTKTQPAEDGYIEEMEDHEILLPNLTSIVYKGTLSFNPKTLKNVIESRWRRKPRKRAVTGKLPGSTYPCSSSSTTRIMHRTPLPTVLDPILDDMSGQLLDPPDSLLFSTNSEDMAVTQSSMPPTPDSPSPSLSPSPCPPPSPGPMSYVSEPVSSRIPHPPTMQYHECFVGYHMQGHSPSQNSGSKRVREEKDEGVQETYYPTAKLQAFEIVALEMDFKIPIDDDTSLAFQQLVEEGFRLRVITRTGLISF